MLLNEPPQEKYSFLAGLKEIMVVDNMNHTKYKNVITLDAPNLSRIAMARDYFEEDAYIINIDHHGDNTSFGNINICYSASSTTEIIYEFIKKLDIPFTKDLAEMICTGIIYDTGLFRFSIATELSFLIAAEMKRTGASIDKIAQEVFFSKDLDTMKLMSHVLTRLDTYEGGKVGVITVSKKDIKKFCKEKPDMDDFINYLMMVKGIEIGIFFIEVQKDYFRVSMRAKDDFNVQKVAAAFSGGGHKKAAGCRMKGKLNELKESLLAEIRKYLADSA
jgi:phosphoesterase RecJ-like protein